MAFPQAMPGRRRWPGIPSPDLSIEPITTPTTGGQIMLKHRPLSSPFDLAARAGGPPGRRPVPAGAGTVAASALMVLALIPAAGAAAAAPRGPAQSAAPSPAVP